MPADPRDVVLKTLLYDCFSGISGDMHLGALIDLGVPEGWLRDELARLPVAGEFELEVAPDSRGGLCGTRATVRLVGGEARPHRHLSDVLAIIAAAGYPAGVEGRAREMFTRLAEAEAEVHGSDVEAVHFHEVGATDAIVDISAAALGLDYLGVERAAVLSLELGGGMVRCDHGLIPVPAPATALLTRGMPCRFGRVEAETTTPTGAAILAATVTGRAPEPFACEAVGYGVGQKTFEIPNVLRVMLGEAGAAGTVDNVEIEANIDDMSPEAFEPVVQALFDAGAKDVFLTPIVMKKGRPAVRVSVLADPGDEGALAEVLLTESSTIGVRSHRVAKRRLPRTERRFETSFGVVRAKIVERPDGRRDVKPEHDDIVHLAAAHGRPYLEVARVLQAELLARIEADG